MIQEQKFTLQAIDRHLHKPDFLFQLKGIVRQFDAGELHKKVDFKNHIHQKCEQYFSMYYDKLTLIAHERLEPFYVKRYLKPEIRAVVVYVLLNKNIPAYMIKEKVGITKK